jgi:hypothetical protein
MTMQSTPVSPVPPERRGQRRLLWFLLLSGPVIYTVYFLASWITAEYACLGEGLTFSVGGMNGVSLVVLALTLVTLGALLASTTLSWRAWRSRRGQEEADATAYDNTAGTEAAMAMVGLLLNGFFVIVTIMTGIPSLVLVACDWV